MPKKSSGGSRSKSASKIEALRRAQQINELLKRSTIESEALQSGGDDRPIGEQHINDLLEEDRGEKRLVSILDKTPVRKLAGIRRSKKQAKKSPARKRR